MLSRRTLVISVVLAMVVSLAAPAMSYAAWNGGHDVVGCTAPGKAWYFAEGTTRSGFNEWICLLNPNAGATNAHLTYMLSDGKTVEKDYNLPARSRTTVDVDNDVEAGN